VQLSYTNDKYKKLAVPVGHPSGPVPVGPVQAPIGNRGRTEIQLSEPYKSAKMRHTIICDSAIRTQIQLFESLKLTDGSESGVGDLCTMKREPFLRRSRFSLTAAPALITSEVIPLIGSAGWPYSSSSNCRSPCKGEARGRRGRIRISSRFREASRWGCRSRCLCMKRSANETEVDVGRALICI
jgi:hypothetical protein